MNPKHHLPECIRPVAAFRFLVRVDGVRELRASNEARLPVCRRLLAVVLAGLAIWFVSAPPKGSDGYRERMGETTRTVRSQVQSARLWAAAFTAGDALSASTAVALEEAERDARGAASQFESYEPPNGVSALRGRFVSLASRATGALADLRIAAQREEWRRLGELAEPLDALAVRLARFERRARP